MATLPLIGSTPGIHQVCTDANTDYPIAIPSGATGCVIWFESDGTITGGRIGMGQDDTAVAGITGTDTVLGYHPPMPVQYEFDADKYSYQQREVVRHATHLHVALDTAGAVVKGQWLF